MSTRFIKSRLGAMPSPPDPRHFRVRAPTRTEAQDIPEEYDGLKEYHDNERWYDQGAVGSCVGWDLSIVLEVTGLLMDMEWENISAGWCYWKSRDYVEPPIPPFLEGSTNLGAMKLLQKIGAVTEECAKTVTRQPFELKACGNAEEIAKSYMIDSYWMVNTFPADMQAAIYGITHPAPYSMPDGTPGKIPLATAFPVYKNAWVRARETGLVDIPLPGDQLLGGHSAPLRGWGIIDDVKHWKVSNSWGRTGDDGTYHIPFGYPFYDAWIIHNGPYVKPPPPEPYEPSDCIVAKAYAEFGSGVSSLLGRKSRFRAVIP